MSPTKAGSPAPGEWAPPPAPLSPSARSRVVAAAAAAERYVHRRPRTPPPRASMAGAAVTRQRTFPVAPPTPEFVFKGVRVFTGERTQGGFAQHAALGRQTPVRDQVCTRPKLRRQQRHHGGARGGQAAAGGLNAGPGGRWPAVGPRWPKDERTLGREWQLWAIWSWSLHCPLCREHGATSGPLPAPLAKGAGTARAWGLDAASGGTPSHSRSPFLLGWGREKLGKHLGRRHRETEAGS